MKQINKLDKDIEELRNLKLQIFQLRKLYDKTGEVEIKNELKKIIITSENIYKEVAINNDKLLKVKNFIDYYIITIQKILEKYVYFKERKISSKEASELYLKVQELLPKVNVSFEKLYQSLFEDDLTDIDAEIKVMLKQMKN